VYELVFHPNVAKDLKSLDKSTRQRILNKIQWLLEHKDVRHEPLTAQWEGTCRLRIGDYRVIYEIDQVERRVIIYAVGHRREIYKLR
jgi:mRNA interferase RelE/StbE